MVLLVPLLIFRKTLGLLKYFLIGRNSFAGTKVNWSASMLSGGLSLMCLVIWGMIHHYQIVHFCLSGGSVAAQLPAFQLKGASHICFEGVWANFSVRQSFVRRILIVLWTVSVYGTELAAGKQIIQQGTWKDLLHSASERLLCDFSLIWLGLTSKAEVLKAREQLITFKELLVYGGINPAVNRGSGVCRQQGYTRPSPHNWNEFMSLWNH